MSWFILHPSPFCPHVPPLALNGRVSHHRTRPTGSASARSTTGSCTATACGNTCACSTANRSRAGHHFQALSLTPHGRSELISRCPKKNCSRPSAPPRARTTAARGTSRVIAGARPRNGRSGPAEDRTAGARHGGGIPAVPARTLRPRVARGRVAARARPGEPGTPVPHAQSTSRRSGQAPRPSKRLSRSAVSDARRPDCRHDRGGSVRGERWSGGRHGRTTRKTRSVPSSPLLRGMTVQPSRSAR